METISALVPSISILVVEDDAVTLEFLVTSLAKKYPHAALQKAIHGRMGLELFKKHMPDVVITDMNMPEFNGVQMAEKILEIRADTRFIVLTGDISLETAGRNELKLDHCIAKPIHFQELFSAVDQCIGRIGQQIRQ